MPRKKKKTSAKTKAGNPRAKHPEKLDLRQTEKHKKPATAPSKAVVSDSMARLKKPGEDKLKRQERKRREREIARKIREVERRGIKEAKEKKGKKKTIERHPLIERDKRLIMYSGVSFFMLLIVFFWIINIKQVFKQTAANSQTNNSLAEFDQLSGDLSEALEEIKNGVREIKSEINATTTVKEAKNENIATGTLPMANEKQFLSDEDILELKQRLEELEEN
jgi:hypothetical protein